MGFRSELKSYIRTFGIASRASESYRSSGIDDNIGFSALLSIWRSLWRAIAAWILRYMGRSTCLEHCYLALLMLRPCSRQTSSLHDLSPWRISQNRLILLTTSLCRLGAITQYSLCSRAVDPPSMILSPHWPLLSSALATVSVFCASQLMLWICLFFYGISHDSTHWFMELASLCLVHSIASALLSR